MRRLSENGLRFAASWEKYAPVAYRATPEEDYLTIGFGHYGADVKPGQKMTVSEALTQLWIDFERVESVCDKYVSRVFTTAQYDAILDLCFNAGVGIVKLDDISGDFDDAVRFGNVVETRRIMSQFVYQKGKVMLGLQRRTAGRLALFDGKKWDEAERIGRSFNP